MPNRLVEGKNWDFLLVERKSLKTGPGRS